jgi:D-alanyl-lipoteichoic acid acyltransferase DltB (MBOAT superfamily)
MAMIVDDIYGNYTGHSSLIQLFGTVIFAFQIYADFSGYTDIARGVSRFFGIELLRNFNFPFFARSIPEFWSRWHISLSSFLNDYLFVPLALSFRDYKKWGVYLAVFITFLVSGFWHGAGWNYVFWGMLHGLYYLPQFTTGNGRLKSLVSQVGIHVYSLNDVTKSLKVFSVVCFALIFFRASSFTEAINFIQQFLQFKNSFNMSELIPTTTHLVVLVKSMLGLLIMLVLEFRLFKNGRHIESLILNKYHVAFMLILLFMLGSFENATQFIYFQF